MIILPYRSNQSSKGSVKVLDPEPLDNVDFDMISCNASDTAVNSISSNSFEPGAGARVSMRRGMRGVKALCIET